mmetsp:Transcript_39759/g.90131  ORF Transcript_39759/g.90131 Transcript_39759/m.90131 type:complete len:371 (-) Transcript_39759:733-1845(-)
MGNTTSSAGPRGERRSAPSTQGGAGPITFQPQAYPGQSAYPGSAYPGAGLPISELQRHILEGMRPDVVNPRQVAPPQMQRTFTIRNDVNLKKNTLKLIRDESVPSHYHIEFTFDASTDCRISVYYAALEQSKEGIVTYQPLKAGSSPPTEQLKKGLGQTFRTRPSHPLDVSQYSPEDLAFNPTADHPRYPIIVCMEAGAERSPDVSQVQSQTTVIKLREDEQGVYHAQPIKQKIQVGKTSYELQEIFGIENQQRPASGEADGTAEDDQNSRECVICMTEARDTTVLPCRHMCMCSTCARQLRVQSNKCPICRTEIEQLLQIKISKQDGTEVAGGGGASSGAAHSQEAAGDGGAAGASAPPGGGDEKPAPC